MGDLKNEKLLSVSEVAQLLGVPASWVYGHTRSRGLLRIPHIKLGKYVRFDPNKVRDWVSKLEGNSL